MLSTLVAQSHDECCASMMHSFDLHFSVFIKEGLLRLYFDLQEHTVIHSEASAQL